MDGVLLTKEHFTLLWPVLQSLFGVAASIIAWLAKRAIDRSEQSTKHMSESVESLRKEFAATVVQLAVAGQTLIDHSAHDDTRFEHLHQRVTRIEQWLAPIPRSQSQSQ